MDDNKIREAWIASRCERIGRVYARALEIAPDRAELIKYAQFAREIRARAIDGSRSAQGIRIADRDRSRVKDTRARAQDRAARADLAQDRAAIAYRKSLSDIASLERAIDRSRGKVRRELKKNLRAARYKHAQEFGPIARVTAQAALSAPAPEIMRSAHRRYADLVRTHDIPGPIDRRPVDIRGVIIPADKRAQGSLYQFDDPGRARANMRSIACFMAIARSISGAPDRAPAPAERPLSAPAPAYDRAAYIRRIQRISRGPGL